MFDREDYVSDSDWEKFLDFSKELETPNIVINLNTIKKNYIKLQIFQYFQVHMNHLE